MCLARWGPRRSLIVVLVATLMSTTAAAAVPAEDVVEEAGIDFVHAGFHLGPGWDRFAFYEVTGGGACWGDHDGDGLMDLYVTDSLDENLEGSSRLYRNEGRDAAGAWRFEDVTEARGAGVAGVGQGCVWGDYDNDGWQDLYVTFTVTDFSTQHNVLLRNLGEGRGFHDVTEVAGVTGDATQPGRTPGCSPTVEVEARLMGRCWSVGAAWLDFDVDGDLDLYVANYAQFPKGACIRATMSNPEYCEGQANRLYRNEGDGTFTDVGATVGVAVNGVGTGGRSLGVVASDLDGDHWPDLYVANDMDGNALYLNQRDGTFRELAAQRGAHNRGPNLTGVEQYRAGMGVDAQDFDNDGLVDLLSTHLRHQHDAVYRNTGDWWTHVGPAWGALPPAYGPSRWGGGFVDLDLDGLKDLVLVAGGEQRPEPGPVHLLLQKDGTFVYQNGSAWPFAEQHLANHRAAAFADYDNDGDVDIFVSTLDADMEAPDRPKLLRFDHAGHDHRYVRVTLQGTDNARDAVGAKVTLATPDGRTQHLWRTSGASYAGSHDPRLLFGIGNATRATVTVTWPGGATQGPIDVDVGDAPGKDLLIVEENARPPPPVANARLTIEGDEIVVTWTRSFAADFAAYRVQRGADVVQDVTDREVTEVRLDAGGGRDITLMVIDTAGHVSTVTRPQGAEASKGGVAALPATGIAAALGAVLLAHALRRRGSH